MKKIIWAILGIALLWIIADFSYGMIQEKQTQKQAEEQTQQIKEEKQADLEEGNNAGQLAYDFEAEDMDGNAVKLSDYRGKKVFLNFWASWCPPCKIEMPHLKAFSEEQEDVVILGVNVTTSETDLDNVTEFLNTYDIGYTNLYGSQKMFNLYRVQSLPTSYIIGKDGVIHERIVGPVTQDGLTEKFAAID